MSAAPRITGQSWAMIAILALTWGAAFPIIEVALEGITPFWLAAYRITVGTLLSFIAWRLLGGQLFDAPITRGDRVTLIIVGILSSALPFMLISWGQQYVTAGFTGVAMASVALFVLPLAHFLVPGERISLRKTMGFIIGFAGIVVLMGPDAFSSTGEPLTVAGQAACLAAAACYALSSILMRRLPPVDPIGLATVLLFIGALFVVPLAWIREGPPPLPDYRTLLALLVLALLPTAAANLLRVVVIRTAGPVFMSLTNYQVPLWSVILGVVFLDEPLHISLLLAMILVLIGVALSQYGALRQLFRRN